MAEQWFYNLLSEASVYVLALTKTKDIYEYLHVVTRECIGHQEKAQNILNLNNPGDQWSAVQSAKYIKFLCSVSQGLHGSDDWRSILPPSLVDNVGLVIRLAFRACLWVYCFTAWHTEGGPEAISLAGLIQFSETTLDPQSLNFCYFLIIWQPGWHRNKVSSRIFSYQFITPLLMQLWQLHRQNAQILDLNCRWYVDNHSTPRFYRDYTIQDYTDSNSHTKVDHIKR